MPLCGIICWYANIFILTNHFITQSQYIATYFSMQELCFNQAIIVQACHAWEVNNQFTEWYSEFRSYRGHSSLPALFLIYVYWDGFEYFRYRSTSKKCLQKNGAVMFEGVVQLKLFPETKIKLAFAGKIFGKIRRLKVEWKMVKFWKNGCLKTVT